MVQILHPMMLEDDYERASNVNRMCIITIIRKCNSCYSSTLLPSKKLEMRIFLISHEISYCFIYATKMDVLDRAGDLLTTIDEKLITLMKE